MRNFQKEKYKFGNEIIEEWMDIANTIIGCLEEKN